MVPEKYKSGSCEERQLDIDNVYEQLDGMVQISFYSTLAQHLMMKNFGSETQGDDKKKNFIRDDVLELFMHSNKLGGTSCGLLYMSLSVHPKAAHLGIIEQCDTCLIVFLHNTTDPMELVCSMLCRCLCVSVCVT